MPERFHIASLLRAPGFLLATAVLGAPLASSQGNREIPVRTKAGVARLEVVFQAPDYLAPWKMTQTRGGTGSAFYIGGKDFLTNAHLVAHSRFIAIRRMGMSAPVPAYVKFVGHDCDLAIVSVDAPEATEGLSSPTFGPLPDLRSPVLALGFPRGGDELSVTEGVVSRIDYRTYAHTSFDRHIMVQIDAAINPGNSGGPVLQGDKVVGVAFQSQLAGQSIGYIIPTPVIQRFLTDVRDGVYDGHPEDGIIYAEDLLINPDMARFHDVPAARNGVLVTHVAAHAPTFGKILPADILLAINGEPILPDGKVTTFGERISFKAIYDLAHIGDKVTFRVRRAGIDQDVPVVVAANAPHYRRGWSYARRPKYFVYGGMVFTTLSRPLLARMNGRLQGTTLVRFLDQWAEFHPLMSDVEEFVILTGRLPHDVNRYLQRYEDRIVARINGVRIRSLSHFKNLMEAADDGYVRVDFLDDDYPLVMKTRPSLEARAGIEEAYGVNPPHWLHGEEIDGGVYKDESASGAIAH